MRITIHITLLVVGILSMLGSLTNAARAGSWSNTGATTFSATAGPMTLASAGLSLTCSGGVDRGSAPTANPSNYTMTVSSTYSPCRVSIFNPSVTCARTLAFIVLAGGVAQAGPENWTCADSMLGCRITGTTPVIYTNPVPPSTPGRIGSNGSTGITVTGCILAGPALLTPNPWNDTVTAGSGGTNPNLGPNLRQP